jgi:hypothetical protein
MPLETFKSSIEYYVIVGWGFSAITNHVMLAAGGRLKGKPPVLHIGGPEPWGQYHPMPMGQWPSLLAPPGFAPISPSAPPYACLPSTAFAASLQSEWTKLVATHSVTHVDARVAAIRLVSNSTPKP